MGPSSSSAKLPSSTSSPKSAPPMGTSYAAAMPEAAPHATSTRAWRSLDAQPRREPGAGRRAGLHERALAAERRAQADRGDREEAARQRPRTSDSSRAVPDRLHDPRGPVAAERPAATAASRRADEQPAASAPGRAGAGVAASTASVKRSAARPGEPLDAPQRP